MPNIGAVLREEITRLSRKESRRQIDSTRKAGTQYRRDIANLKQQVTQLERQVRLLSRKVLGASQAAAPAASAGSVRFGAKSVRSQRLRLDLSAEDFGKLVGVSAQSIYNWENGKARPRAEQIAALARVRSIGKREAQARVQQARKG